MTTGRRVGFSADHAGAALKAELLRRVAAARPGDTLAVLSAGAYGMSMASNYNSRGRPAEVLVSGDAHWVVREREAADRLYALERLLPMDGTPRRAPAA